MNEELITCPKCKLQDPTHDVSIVQHRQPGISFVGVGWRCVGCGHEWGNELPEKLPGGNDYDLKESLFGKKECPDCKGKKFLEGPHGGLSVNIKCASCGSKFNIYPPFFAERIGKRGDKL